MTAMSIAAVAGAQTTRPPIAQRPTEMRALPVRSMTDVAAINAFRHGTVAGPHPVSPAGAEANQIATFVVRDTVFSQNAVPTGEYAYAVEPLFRMLNDSQEVWATAFGGAIGIEVPHSSTVNFCPAQ